MALSLAQALALRREQSLAMPQLNQKAGCAMTPRPRQGDGPSTAGGCLSGTKLHGRFFLFQDPACSRLHAQQPGLVQCCWQNLQSLCSFAPALNHAEQSANCDLLLAGAAVNRDDRSIIAAVEQGRFRADHPELAAGQIDEIV